jgi:hypothetical protein
VFDGERNSDLNCKLTKRLEFDANNKYLIVYGQMDLNIIPLESDEPTISHHLKIDKNIFTEVIDC